MKKVGFITYNSLPNIEHGWIHSEDGVRSVLVIHDTKGQGALGHGKRTRSAEEIMRDIEERWDVLDQSLLELDHLVVYVGASGSERAIERAATIPVERLTFIGCSCGIGRKEAMIQAYGLEQVRRFLCECGGHTTMVQMIQLFLAGDRVF